MFSSMFLELNDIRHGFGKIRECLVRCFLMILGMVLAGIKCD